MSEMIIAKTFNEVSQLRYLPQIITSICLSLPRCDVGLQPCCFSMGAGVVMIVIVEMCR